MPLFTSGRGSTSLQKLGVTHEVVKLCQHSVTALGHTLLAVVRDEVQLQLEFKAAVAGAAVHSSAAVDRCLCCLLVTHCLLVTR
jgi:hypothetical protein